MLKLLLGTDWVANSNRILESIANDVANRRENRILMVPELISHDTERRLCAQAGDTCSRYAQVLSFSRLARRVTEFSGYGMPPCLDNGGRIVAMASAARQLHSKLKAYASVETKPEFLSGLLDTVDELKRCCVTAADLRCAAAQAEGALAQKLEEIALLYEAYDGLCQQGKCDPRGQMTWLLEQLQECSFAQKHIFYIDAFPDFSRQHMAILEHLICCSPCVTVSLNCDTPGSHQLAYELAGQTAADLIRIAKHHGIAVEIEYIAPESTRLLPLHQNLLQGAVPHMDACLQVAAADTVYEECVMAAERIRKLVQDGARYRDICVVCGDMPAYRSAVAMVFRRCDIPVYQSGTEEILDKSAIYTVLSAMEAALGGFEQRDVLRYIKSVASPMTLEECDALESYAILWSITGSRWLKPWTMHPRGLNEAWDPRWEAELTRLNALRSRAVDSLIRLEKGFRDAKNLAQQVLALYAFLEDIQLAGRLEGLANELEAAGDNRGAMILDQLWQILLSALEQLHAVLGETIWDTETFTRLFKLLLSQYDVGTIPSVLDAVLVGPASAMRCQRCQHLIVLGALEGAMPGYGGSSGVFTDGERMFLREQGVALTQGAVEGIQRELSEIYGVFCGARQSVHVSCPAGQPSFVYRRLLDMAGGLTEHGQLLGPALADPVEAGAFLARWNAQTLAEDLRILSDYQQILRKRDHQLGDISRENIEKLYGKKLRLSASQVDKQAQCRLAYFLKYGLAAREQKPAEVDPAEFGTYVHWVLEQTVGKVMDLGGFHMVSLEKTLQLAGEYSDAYAREKFSQLDSQRLEYLFRRNAQELEMIVQELWDELRNSQFVPVDWELAFGAGEKMPGVDISGANMKALLRGIVDRVDVWQASGQNYFRVVDYKTGKKDFDYCDIFHGIGLQMLLYMFALADNGRALVGDHTTAAGVQYFPARAPLISADGVLTDQEAETAREKVWKRKGLLLQDEAVLEAMDTSEGSWRMPYKRKNDGTVSGDLADRDQFALLKRYVFKVLGELVDEIASGNVTPNPYTRGSSFNVCGYCPYGSICHAAYVEGRRNYQAMSAQRFWDEIEKEMNTRG